MRSVRSASMMAVLMILFLVTLSASVLPSGDSCFPNGARLSDCSGNVYYSNGARARISSGAAYYSNGVRACDAMGNSYYPDGSRIMTNSGTMYYQNGARLLDSSMNAYYSNGARAMTSSGDTYYENGSRAGGAITIKVCLGLDCSTVLVRLSCGRASAVLFLDLGYDRFLCIDLEDGSHWLQ